MYKNYSNNRENESLISKIVFKQKLLIISVNDPTLVNKTAAFNHLYLGVVSVISRELVVRHTVVNMKEVKVTDFGKLDYHFLSKGNGLLDGS